MEKLNLRKLMEEVRLIDLANKLVKMNEEQIIAVVSTLNEETKTGLIDVLEAKLPKPKKVKVDADIRMKQQVSDIIKKAGGTPRAEADALSAPSSQPRPAADIKPGDMRSNFLKKPDAAPRPAADIKQGDTRSVFAKGPEPKVKVSDQPNPDAAMRAKGIEEPKAAPAPKKDATNKVIAGLAGTAAVAAAAGYGLTRKSEMPPSAGATPPAAAPAPAPAADKAPEPTSTKMKVAKGDTLSGIAQKNKVSVADLVKANQGIKDVNKIGIGQELVIPKATNNPIYQGGIGTKAGPSKSQNIMAPKKAVKEESENFLIGAFLKIQSSGAPNLFEAAKKAKKDWDKDGKIESGKDEYMGSRIRAAKAAGNMKEESEADKAKKNPMSKELDAPSSGGKAPDTTTNPEWLKKVKTKEQTPTRNLKGSLPKGVKEEVEFSEAELAHIASILEANPIAPVPDDYSGAAGGVSKRDLSDETVAEANSKKKAHHGKK